MGSGYDSTRAREADGDADVGGVGDGDTEAGDGKADVEGAAEACIASRRERCCMREVIGGW